MKKLLLIQILLLTCTVILGSLLKYGIVSGLGGIHGLLGITSGILGIGTVIFAFKQKQNKLIKVLSIVIVLLIINAGMGGRSLEQTTNYELSFNQMAISGILALIASAILLFKLKSSSSAKKK